MMKEYIIIALAMLASAACTKVVSNMGNDREIAFNVANYVHTRATGVLYEGGNFGTYAWFNDTDEFMVNEEVGLKESSWTTLNNTFYWPKTGAITFVSYSPFNGSATVAPVPAVTLDGDGIYTIDYGTYTVGTDDIMYADLATCSENVDEINDGVDSGYNGVPTLFRHALAKVHFEARAGFLQKGTDPDITTWEITVTAANTSDIFTTGQLSMAWSGSEWTKPAGNVWTNPTVPADTDFDLGTNGLALTEKYQTVGDLGFVLPQTLDAQAITISLHIKTNLSNGKSFEEDITKTIPLTDFSADLQSWQMNQNIVYYIIINPVNDAAEPILFDPAVVDWVPVSAEYTISL